MNVTTNNAEALRALLGAGGRLVNFARDVVRNAAGVTDASRQESVEAREAWARAVGPQFDPLLAALASQPQAAGAGGDAGIVRYGVRHTRRYGTGIEPSPTGPYVRYEDHVAALAATPAPAVEAVNGMRCTDCGTTGTVFFMCQACSHGNYPPAEARKPEPRGAVDADMHVPTTPAHELQVDAALLRADFPLTAKHRANMAARLDRIAATLAKPPEAVEHNEGCASVRMNRPCNCWLSLPENAAPQGARREACPIQIERDGVHYRLRLGVCSYLTQPASGCDDQVILHRFARWAYPLAHREQGAPAAGVVACDGMVCPDCKSVGHVLYQCVACSHGNYPPDATRPSAAREQWTVIPFSGSFKRRDERWEVYSPNGSGGAVEASEIESWIVRDLLDHLAAAPSPAEGDAS